MTMYKGAQKFLQWAHRKSARILLALSILVVTFSVSASAQLAPYLPAEGPDPDSLSLEEALSLVERYELTRYGAQRALLRAGKSGERRHAVVLRRIVQRYAEGYSKLAFNALHSLRLVGEPRAYFLRLARERERAPLLAYYAVWVLAAEPDEKTYELLLSLREATSDGFFVSAVETYGDVLAYERQYHERTEDGEPITDEIRLAAMADLLAEGYRFGAHGPVGGLPVVETDPYSHLNPLVVWAREKLRKLAIRYPDEALTTIYEVATSPEIEDYYRGNLSDSEWQEAVEGFQAYAVEAAFPKGKRP